MKDALETLNTYLANFCQENGIPDGLLKIEQQSSGYRLSFYPFPDKGYIKIWGEDRSTDLIDWLETDAAKRIIFQALRHHLARGVVVEAYRMTRAVGEWVTYKGKTCTITANGLATWTKWTSHVDKEEIVKVFYYLRATDGTVYEHVTEEQLEEEENGHGA